VKVTYSRPYVPFLITGTRPYLIEPRELPGVLRFLIGEEVVYARRVNHPGTRPVPALEAAIERLEHTAAVDLHDGARRLRAVRRATMRRSDERRQGDNVVRAAQRFCATSLLSAERVRPLRGGHP
jgi:hypothetical protein